MTPEVEAKFALSHLADLRHLAIALGGRVVRDRMLERNWRYDTPDGRLTNQGHVLRLRQDDRITLTYKQPGPDPLIRSEIEIEVDHLGSTHAFLQALGFVVLAVYEKYREGLRLGEVQVVLDELPFGAFVELEAESGDAIRTAADRLGLAWEHRVPFSYLELFDRLRQDYPLAAGQATFEAFAELSRFTPEQLGLADARTAADPAAS